MTYLGARVLVTGGLGFIGSNLALRLHREGAEVTVVDPALPGCGGNLANLDGIEAIRVATAGIGEPAAVRQQIESADVIFNLAGEISHVHSVDFPERDLHINVVAQMRFLEACRRWHRGVRVVYAGTRQVYGQPEYLPVDEKHPVNPVDYNGVHKYAANQYHLMLSRNGDLDAVTLRLTNVYGPRMALHIPCQGFLSTFLRKALLGEPLEVFGTGLQLRDPLHVDDAVDAFLLAGLARPLATRQYNLAGPQALTLDQIAAMIAGRDAGHTAFPPERQAIDIGSYYGDSSLIQAQLGWRPRIPFEEGIARTMAFYRERWDIYLTAPPTCNLPEHTGVRPRLSYGPVA
ncbi:MAG: NAD-dependent epimerase/dehydratase family protein [Acidobacteria bacterium]|nr:NAD-dependent epimerase/dehydratase family protein [Acidobacteriota bacterium]